MKIFYFFIIVISSILTLTLISNHAYAQPPDVACGWHLWFYQYEFNENDTIPIKVRDPCYPQEGKIVTVSVSDGDTTIVTGRYLNQTITATNSTFIINFKKPIDSNQYRFLVTIEVPPNTYTDYGTGDFIFTKTNASKVTITEFSISSPQNSTGNQIHVKLMDGLGNPLKGEKWGLSVHVELNIPKCDFGRNCLNPNLDLTPNESDESFSTPFSIPSDLSSGVYNMTVSVGSFYKGYQPTSIVVPVSINHGIMTESTVPEFPFAIPILLVGIATMIIFYRIKIGK